MSKGDLIDMYHVHGVDVVLNRALMAVFCLYRDLTRVYNQFAASEHDFVSIVVRPLHLCARSQLGIVVGFDHVL